MASRVKTILFILVIITMFLGSESQFRNFPLPLSGLVEMIFPKDPNIVKVRTMKEVGRSNNAAVLDFIGLVERFGYPAEEHLVTTADGYNLLIHRIPDSPRSKKKGNKEVVFIQHGILCSSDNWVLFGPDKDLAFLLADKGYDVWLGNFRGNTYGRSHVKLSTRDPRFWKFSFHEIGLYDLPAMFDYVLNYTNQRNLNYVAHSMGTTSLFVLLSMRPEYNEKIRIAICMSPIAFWTEISPMFKEIINFTPFFQMFLNMYRIYDVVPQSELTVTVGRYFCNDNAITQPICITILFLIVGSDPKQLNTTALPFIFSYFPAGASVQTLMHYYQNIVINNFQSYDYGVIGNYAHYKQRIPISYDLNKVRAPIVLIVAANDGVGRKRNVVELNRRLPNVVLMEEIPFKYFNHMDVMWALDGKTLLYDRVIQIIDSYNRTITS